MERDLDRINERLTEIHRDRRWIVCVDAAAAAVPWVERLRQWDAGDVLVVAAVEGVGDLPDVEIVYTRSVGETMMAGFRAFRDHLADPSPETAAAIEAFDPTGEATVMTGFWSLDTVLGRRVYGQRSPAVEALEDKMIVDELWDRAGVNRADVEIVDVADAPAAHDRLSSELGTVWTADNRHGWHGGAEYTRWVRPDRDPESFVAWFADRAHQVRVMPFLDGLPCSIHGFVTPHHVAAFRPIEMVILRRPGRSDFRYAGLASFWDPPAEDREDMRAAVRRVGAVLRERTAYLGGFAIDGVMTAHGFRPTELNPRLSAGLRMQAVKVPELHLDPIERAMRSGDLQIDAEWLEETVVAAADATRAGGMGLSVPGASLERHAAEIVFENGVARRAVTGEQPQASLAGGPSAAGAFVRMQLDPEVVEPGPAAAPRAAAAARFTESEWGLAVGDVEPAPDLRT